MEKRYLVEKGYFERFSERRLEELLRNCLRTQAKITKAHLKIFRKTYYPSLRKRGETWKELNKRTNDLEKVSKKLERIIERIRYWYGKAKGKDCPAFEKTAPREVRCWLFPFRDDLSPRHYPNVSSHQDIFIHYCSYCPLSKEEALKRVRWMRILNTK